MKEILLKSVYLMCAVLMSDSSSQCLAFELDGPALPNRPWISVWNGPTQHCAGHFGIHINLSHFDIVQNPRDQFTGEFMSIFYHLGAFPRIMPNGTVVNGAIPQLGNLTYHLEKARSDIMAILPELDFQGLAVIDFESYKPIWEEDWDQLAVYKNMSRDLVRKRHPDWTKDQVEETAKEEFESAAKVFMLQTLQLGVSMRPRGHWGYYHYPYCFDNVAKLECRERFRELNDKESWLFDASQALYPSIYLSGFHPESERWKMPYAIIKEAFRMANQKSRRLPVFAYTKFQYNERVPYWFYTETDLINNLKIGADFGCAGVVIWSPTDDFDTREGCLLLQAFMDKRMGPLVRAVTQYTVKCSRDRCSSNGRCVKHSYFPNEGTTSSWGDDNNSVVTEESREALQNSGLEFESGLYDEYICHCYKGWHGDKCETKD